MPTVPSTPRSTTISLASSSAGPFLVGFRVFEDDSLSVYVDGAEVTDWAMSATYSGGYDDVATITFTSALDAGVEILIEGNLTPQRQDDYENADPGLVEKMNIELARLWAAVSEARMRSVRSLRFSTDTPPLQIPDDGAVLIWKDGRVVSGPTADEIDAAQGYAEDAAASAEAAATWDPANYLPKAGNLAGLASVTAALTNLGFSAFMAGLRANADAAALRAAIGARGTAALAVSDLAAAAVRELADGFATPLDTELPTAAWVDGAVPAKLNAAGAAPIYACRSWVAFNGTGAVAIRASGNVSSITDNGVGNYTVNIATFMPDANYSVVACAGDSSLNRLAAQVSDLTTTSFRIYVLNHGNSFLSDAVWVNAAVFR